MTSEEMYQEFQVYMDKIDSQDLPEIQPEQVFTFLNLAVDEYIQAIRNSFEQTGKLADDFSSLVKRIYIPAEIEDDRVKFDYTKALSSVTPNIPISIYYLLNGRFRSSITKNEVTKEGISDINWIQQDDINPALGDPFNKPLFADKVPCVRENHALYATPPSYLVLSELVGTCIVEPTIISESVNCNLPKQIHKTIVKRATELALEDVESRRVATFNK